MSDKDPGLCRYVFDPSERETEPGVPSSFSEDVLDDGVWRCPHRSHDSYDLCVFHLPPERTDDTVVRERFLDRVGESGRRPKQFIDASFGRLDLDYEIVESADNHSIDLRYASFTDATTWEYAIVRQPLNLEATTFHDTADFMETRFRNEVYLSGATFEAEARFYETRFTQGGWFYGASFDTANFHRSTFGGHADFIETHFQQCHLREALFEGRAHFDKSTFEHASLPGVRFEGDAYFDEASFPERVNLEHAHFAGGGSFTDLDVPDGTCCVDLGDATITSGALAPAVDGELVYDLRDATIGNVHLTEGGAPPGLFTHYHVLNTSFDGFDFGAYRDVLNAADWTLHEVTDVPGLNVGNGTLPTAGELESTYLKAKNGANAIGDTKAAAEFFRREMGYRRQQYAQELRNPEHEWRHRIGAAWRWVANGVLDVTAGYGERPSRVVVASITIVGLFTGLFSATTSVRPYESPVGHLVLSLESFVTLVLGGAAPIEDPWIRLLAQVEGFVGAFLIALFVFTLTRSIHR